MSAKYGTKKDRTPRNSTFHKPPPIPHPLSDALMSEGAYNADQEEFLKAIEAYKRLRRRPFPTCCEVLAILRSLGYRKVEAPTELPKYEHTHVTSTSPKE